MKQTTLLLLSVISTASAGDCSQYKTAGTCLGCEDVGGTCTQTTDPCVVHSETECGSATDCHWMAGTGECMSNLGVVDACNGAVDCLNCVWNGGECKALDDTCGSATTEATCNSCHKMNNMCMSNNDPCAGMESHCASMSQCTLDNGVCKLAMDPCMSAKYCGDCSWNSNFGGACQVKPQSLSTCGGNGETHCRECEMSGGKCSSTKDPCTGMEDHCAMMVPSGMCKMENGVCVLSADPCESSGYCGSCSWDSSTETCSEKRTNIIPGTCATNVEGSCLSCHEMPGGICMSNSDPCNGMESHCSSMTNCELKNNVCSYKVDPCTATAFCGDCYWNNGECKQSDGTQTAAPVDHSLHLSSSGQMVMTFFDSHKVVILWNEIDIDDKGLYALAIIISFILPMIVMVLRDFITRRSDIHLALRMGLMLVVFTLSNLVMLIVMIMNVGLFVAIMIGSTIGFGIVEFLKMKKVEDECSESSKGQSRPDALDQAENNECHYP